MATTNEPAFEALYALADEFSRRAIGWNQDEKQAFAKDDAAGVAEAKAMGLAWAVAAENLRDKLDELVLAALPPRLNGFELER